VTNVQKFHVELGKRAKKDLKKLPRDTRERIVGCLKLLEEGQPNLNMKVITDKPPFLRLRVGDFRVLLQPLTEPEMQRLLLQRGHLPARNVFVVARVVDRADFDRALATLEMCEID
jgi:mRNA-degrading endonuclease RelE of RelBE toxin-antitoxin system